MRSDEPNTTYRHLQIGKHKFWLRYYSDDAWRSNFGNVENDVLEQTESLHPLFPDPLFAIDYVKSNGRLYAIDYNVAPQIKGTGIEDILSSMEVVQAIKNDFFNIIE